MINDELEPIRKQERDEYKRDSIGRFASTDSRGGDGDSSGGQSSIKEQLRASLDEINNTKTLFEIHNDEVSYDFKISAQRVQKDLEKSNGFVKREGFGNVQVSSRLFTASAYFKTKAEKTAILAVPEIIKNGIKIGGHTDHKGRTYSTLTFAGKVTIAGEPGVMAVVVKKTTGNFYKVHRVLTPDGKTMEI